ANAIAVEGQYVYVLGLFQLAIVDATDLLAPFLVSQVRLLGIGYGIGRGSDVLEEGGFLYLAMGLPGVRVLDVRVPAAPVEVAALLEGSTALSLAFSGNLLFVGGPGRLTVFDVSDPFAPVELGRAAFTGELDDLEVTGDLLVAAAGSRGVLVFDVTDPAAP
ncbi:MAG: hypothetical protein KDD47_00015, partial [Acidobacteria bacterium]|nr:hypothetical protein [Acidobacteriota bacterium]